MIDLYGFGLHDVILLIAGVAGVYLVLMWLRLTQLRRRRSSVVAPKPSSLQENTVIEWLTPATGASLIEPKVEESSSLSPSFADHLRKSGLEAEVHRLQHDLQILRREFETLRDEHEKMRAARHVSPLYNEAMGFAQQGVDADGIAARCGISIAEAELVAALATKSNAASDEYLDEDLHGRPAQRRVA